jgi:hypothetical protein
LIGWNEPLNRIEGKLYNLLSLKLLRDVFLIHLVFKILNAAAEDDSGLKDKDQKISDISEDEQAEQATPQQELCAMPTNPSDHEIVERLDRSIELEHFPQAESKHKMNSMPVEASEHVTVTQIEEKQLQQAEVTQELDSLPICSREQAEVTQAGLEQECGSVPIDSGGHGCLTSYAHTDVEQAEMKQKVTSVTTDVLDYAAGTFNVNTNTWKGKMLRPQERCFCLPILVHSDCYLYYYCVIFLKLIIKY